MEQKKSYQMNISAPNLITVCIANTENGEISGRFYHCYKEEPVAFANVVELLTKAERLFDGISFPQASTETRRFDTKKSEGTRKIYNVQRPRKSVEQTEIIQYTGDIATFVVWVKFRQNATWQGESIWMEKGRKETFENTLELIAQIDKTLQKEKKY